MGFPRFRKVAGATPEEECKTDPWAAADVVEALQTRARFREREAELDAAQTSAKGSAKGSSRL